MKDDEIICNNCGWIGHVDLGDGDPKSAVDIRDDQGFITGQNCPKCGSVNLADNVAPVEARLRSLLGECHTYILRSRITLAGARLANRIERELK